MVITGTIGNRVVFTGSGVRIPSLPPNKTNRQKFACSFCFDVAERGFERVGSRLANDTINDKKKQADQTTDETVVCNPGVIATLLQKMSVKIK